MFEIDDIEKMAKVNEVIELLKNNEEVNSLYDELQSGDLSKADFELEAWYAIKDTLPQLNDEYKALTMSRAMNKYLISKGYRG